MNPGRGRELTGSAVTVSAHGTEHRNDSLGKHGEYWDTWGWQRHVDGAGCFIEKAQSTRLTSVRVSDDDTEGSIEDGTWNLDAPQGRGQRAETLRAARGSKGGERESKA